MRHFRDNHRNLRFLWRPEKNNVSSHNASTLPFSKTWEEFENGGDERASWLALLQQGSEWKSKCAGLTALSSKQ